MSKRKVRDHWIGVFSLHKLCVVYVRAGGGQGMAIEKKWQFLTNLVIRSLVLKFCLSFYPGGNPVSG